MTSKYKLSEQILRIFSGGNISRDAQITIQELSIAVTQEFAIAVKANYYRNRAEGVTEVNGSYIYSFQATVLNDEELGMKYSQIPSPFIDLPNEMGIHQVSYKNSQNDPFVRTPNGFLGLMQGLPLDGLEGRVGFYTEADRIYYINIDTNKDVIFKLAVALDTIDDDTLINISPDIQSMIIDNVTKKYMVEQQIPHDNINNGVKT